MLAAVSGLCMERKSETSILASPSGGGGLVAVLFTIVEKGRAVVEQEEWDSGLTSPTLEEDLGRQQEEGEVAEWWGSSDESAGGGSEVCCCVGGEMMEDALFVFLSLAESLQAHWHWQDSSCLMMMTGRLRPICWTEFPETETTWT